MLKSELRRQRPEGCQVNLRLLLLYMPQSHHRNALTVAKHIATACQLQ